MGTILQGARPLVEETYQSFCLYILNNFPSHRKTQFSNSVGFGLYEFFMKFPEFWNSRICSIVTVGVWESRCLPLTQMIRMKILWLFDKFHLNFKCDYLVTHGVSCPTECITPYLFFLSSATSCIVYYKLVCSHAQTTLIWPQQIASTYSFPCCRGIFK